MAWTEWKIDSKMKSWRWKLPFASSVLLIFIVFHSISSSSGSWQHHVQRRSGDPQPVSLCPSPCSCTEQKSSKAADGDEIPETSSKASTPGKNKGSPEILKNGIRVQCAGNSQNGGAVVSIKKLNLPGLLVENTVILDLSGNNLSKIDDEDFSSGSFSMLQKLILKNNQIEDISTGALKPLEYLKYLDISNNQFLKISASSIKDLKNLERIKLNGNPIICDCSLAPFLQTAAKRNIKLQGACSAPSALKDRPLSKISTEELACSRQTKESISIEIRPATNQIVFEGDPLKLTCRVITINPMVKIIWLHQSLVNESTNMVTASNGISLTLISRNAAEDGHSVMTESSLHIRNLQQAEHGGSWICSSIVGNRSTGPPVTASKSVEVTVLSLNTPTCSGDVTNSNRGRYGWPRTMAGLKIQLPCQANPHVSAWRLCASSGAWEEPDVSSCSYLNEVTKVLEQFAKTNLTFSKTSALESARRLKSYLSDVAALTDPHDAMFVTRTLHNYLDATGRHPELLPVIMDVLSILIKQDPTLLADSRHELLTILQQAPLKSSEFEYQSSTLAVEKTALITSAVAETCTWRRNGVEPAQVSLVPKPKSPPVRNRLRLDCFPSAIQINSTVVADMEASVRIPLTSDALAIQQQTIVLSLLSSANPLINAHSPLEIVTAVVGISSGHVTNQINRTAPFVITLRLVRHLSSDRLLALVGARWNPYSSEWSREQCVLIGTRSVAGNNNFVTFQCCCGFGFFAAFVTRQAPESALLPGPGTPGGYAIASSLLPPPVYVGSVVCLLCHMTAVFTYLIHHDQLQMTRPTKHGLINSWISVSFLVTVFTVGIHPMFGRLSCQTVGLLLHYLTLSCLLWMVVGASGLYKHLTKNNSKTDGADGDSSAMEDQLASREPGQEYVAKPALRFYLIGWGVALIVVGIAGAIHMDQYGGLNSGICFLTKTPAMGAVGLPSAILIFLILTFHLLTWCYVRHTERIRKQLASMAIAIQPDPESTAKPPEVDPVEANRSVGGSTDPSVDTGAAGSSLVATELTICVLNQSRADGYLPLGNGGSCPSNLTQATQVTEVSDLTLTSASSGQEQERIALLINRCQQPVQPRGEAEGGPLTGENHCARSDIERPLLMVTSCSEDGLETAEDGTGSEAQGKNLDGDDRAERGHSNPLMASFTDDGDSKKQVKVPGLLMTAQRQQQQQQPLENYLVPIVPCPQLAEMDQSDVKSTLSQLRGQLTWLLLFVATWISAMSVVSRPLRDTLPYDEMLSSLSYAICSAAMGLHTLIFHLLTRKDVIVSCCAQPSPKAQVSAAQLVRKDPPEVNPPAPAELFDTLRNSRTVEECSKNSSPVVAIPVDPVMEMMNVVSLEPSVTLVNSFYDPRQSKTARRFFQKQKMLNQTAQNNQLGHHRSHHHHGHHSHHHHGHRRHLNNTQAQAVSHSPIAEEALLNVSSSSKAKVSNVNIHVELGAYDWHELQGRISDNSWSKTGKSLLPSSTCKAPCSERADGINADPETQRKIHPHTKAKRRRHGHHQRKKSKWEEEMKAAAEEKAATSPVYAFVDYDYRDKALAHVSANDEALKTLTSVKIRVRDDQDESGDAEALKRETSV